MGVMDLVLEAEGLGDEEFEREDVVGGSASFGRERVDRDGVVLGFGRQEDTGEPASESREQVSEPVMVPPTTSGLT